MRILYLLLFTGAFWGNSPGQTFEASSPSGILQVSFTLEDGVPHYRVRRFGMEIIKSSRLGLTLNDTRSLNSGFAIDSTEKSNVDETWTQPWGEKKDIRNHYNELRVDLVKDSSDKMTIVFRVYDDGVGFRYEIPEQPNLDKFEIMDELTEFALAGDHKAWWIGAYQWNRYEYLYQQSAVSAIDTVQTPFTMETNNSLYLSIHEAALTDYASMTLARTGKFLLKADLVPWSDGVKVKTSTPMKTPWRTIQITDTPGDLITSYLILNLNEPNKLGDVSERVKPGTYVGIWWEMH